MWTVFQNQFWQFDRLTDRRFNFQDFNLEMIKEKVSECIIAFDPSYISKSGKNTYRLGSYWSGCAGKMKRGLAICGFAAVDIALNTAFHLHAIQTPVSKDFNLLHYYCQIIKENYLYFKELTNYMVADSYFAKSEAVQTITALGMHFILRLRSATISRLRDDAVLYYLNRENCFLLSLAVSNRISLPGRKTTLWTWTLSGTKQK